MKIAYAGDWHGNTSWAEHTLHSLRLAGVKQIIHVGDFGLWPNGDTYLDRVQEALERNNQHLVWVDGNHDDHNQLDTWPAEDDRTHLIRPRIRHLPRGHRWTWNNTSYLAMGGAVSIDRDHRIPGRSWWPQEAISDADVNTATQGGPVDVLVCHDAPTEVPSLDRYLATNGFTLTPAIEVDAYHQRVQIRRIITATTPRLVVHGHYHHRYTDHAHGASIIGLDCDGSSYTGNTFIPETENVESGA